MTKLDRKILAPLGQKESERFRRLLALERTFNDCSQLVSVMQIRMKLAGFPTYHGNSKSKK